MVCCIVCKGFIGANVCLACAKKQGAVDRLEVLKNKLVKYRKDKWYNESIFIDGIDECIRIVDLELGELK